MSAARVDPCSVEFIGAYFFMTGRKHSIKRFRFGGFLRLMGTESGMVGYHPHSQQVNLNAFSQCHIFSSLPARAAT